MTCAESDLLCRCGAARRELMFVIVYNTLRYRWPNPHEATPKGYLPKRLMTSVILMPGELIDSSHITAHLSSASCTVPGIGLPLPAGPGCPFTGPCWNPPGIEPN